MAGWWCCTKDSGNWDGKGGVRRGRGVFGACWDYCGVDVDVDVGGGLGDSEGGSVTEDVRRHLLYSLR